MIRIGTAGWSIRSDQAALFPAEGAHLSRYAARFDAVEINSSFYRPHLPATYARWAGSVPDGFRFAVKLPRAITHDAKLVDAEVPLRAFAAQVVHLGDRLGPILVQLPPKLAFDPAVAARFLETAAGVLPAPMVCEPRHPSWFDAPADRMLAAHQVARVAADPAPVAEGARPGGWLDLAYFRLHGSPHVYSSGYGPERLRAWCDVIAAGSGRETWCIFDNTARGEAVLDAATLSRWLRP